MKPKILGGKTKKKIIAIAAFKIIIIVILNFRRKNKKSHGEKYPKDLQWGIKQIQREKRL